MGTVIAAASNRGELARDVDVNLAGRAIFGLYFMGIISWMSGLATIETVLDPTLRNALELLVRGLRA